MKRKEQILYGFLYVFMLGLSLMIQPSGDDWLFLRYFPLNADWHVGSYNWLFNNILLPREFWRPWEDLLGFGEAHFPSLFPYFNHFFIITLHFASGIFLLKIMKHLNIKENVAFYTTLFYLMATTAMGVAFSVDSTAQALATFFGVLSINIYLSSFRFKYLLWGLIGFIACFSKESGFVFFLIAPLVKLLMEIRVQRLYTIKQINMKRFIKSILIASIPLLFYLGVYLSLTIIHNHVDPTVQPAVSQMIQKDNFDLEETTIGLMTSSQMSYKLTATTFVKNVFILYAAAIFPIDTSSIYYNNWWLLMFTLLLSFISLLIFIRVLHSKKIQLLQLFVCLLLILVASSPFLITRAGEMSPHQVNLFMALLLAILFETYELKKIDYILLFLFVVSTLITDSHKYSLAFTRGNMGKAMAKEVKKKSIPNPNKVLWIGPNESSLDRAGGAFNSNPYHSFGQGNAVIREYGYQFPKHLDKIRLQSPVYDQNKIDDIIESKKEEYDCIWITHQNIVEVINCHQ